MNGIHDVGGMDGFGPIEREENEPVFRESWEGRMRGIHTIVSKKHRIYNTDEGRYGVERVDPVFFLGASYNQIWLLRTEKLLIEKGVLTEQEIEERMSSLFPKRYTSHLQQHRDLAPPIRSKQRKMVLPHTSGPSQAGDARPKYGPGTIVKVRVSSPLGHTRVPRYVRGRQGVIVNIHGSFPVPDIKVHEGATVYQPVYLVCFEARELWGEDASPKDKLYIEMWEDYLETGVLQHEEP